MTQTEKDITAPRKEQITYANVLSAGAWTGIFLMTVTYILYITGTLTPHVDVNLVVHNWDKNVHDYLQITNSPYGWSWVTLLGKGDFINFIGMVLLALMTILCYLIILKGYLARKNFTYATICILEVLVLALAASGIFGSGGH